MRITDISPIGEQTIKNKGAVIIGTSIDNSYFTEENLKNIMIWVTLNTGPVYIMIPDEPAIYTMMGKGYSRVKATAKVRLKANALENKCRRVAANFDIPIEIVRLSLVPNADILSGEPWSLYPTWISGMREYYKADKNFRLKLRTATKEVLSTGGKYRPSTKQINVGVNFLIQELAFILGSKDILGECNVAYIYHKTIPALKYILNNKNLWTRKACPIGYITLENEL